MATWERFRNAPIAEALIDIHVRFSSPIDVGQLESFQNEIAGDFPWKQPRVMLQGEIQLAPGAVQQALRHAAEGFMFRSRDGRRIVQARQDGYTFNWLKPYQTWEVFRDEGRTQWERYRSMFRPEAVARLGLRYINRIDLPIPFNDLRDFIKTAPEVADGVPQGLRPEAWPEPFWSSWRVGLVPLLADAGVEVGEILFDDASDPRAEGLRRRWELAGVTTSLVPAATGSFIVGRPSTQRQ